MIHSDIELAKSVEQFMHPDGGSGLIFNYADDQHINDGTMYDGISWDSSRKYSQRIALKRNVHAFGIRFQPGGFFDLFGIPLKELEDIDAIQDVLGHNKIRRLKERIYGAKSFQGKVKVAQDWLLEHANESLLLTPAVREGLELMNKSGGQSTVDQLKEYFQISYKHLERLFNEQVGLRPKEYSNLIRVSEARKILKRPALASIAQAGYEANYYDQSHFNRQFKKVVGMTPGSYRKRKLGLVDGDR